MEDTDREKGATGGERQTREEGQLIRGNYNCNSTEFESGHGVSRCKINYELMTMTIRILIAIRALAAYTFVGPHAIINTEQYKRWCCIYIQRM